MEVMRNSVFNRIGALPKQKKNIVCKFWLQGRCKNNQCRFLHRESPPPQMNHSKSNYIHQNQSCRKMVWKNQESYCNPKPGTSYQKIPQKVDAKVLPVVESDPKNQDSHCNLKSGTSYRKIAQKKVGTKVLPVVESDPEKNDTQEAPAKPCKYAKLAELQGHTQGITGIALPDGCDKLYTCSKDKSIRAWDCNSGQFVGSVSTDGEVGCLITEGPWVVVGLPNLVKAWNIQNQEAEFSADAPAGLVCRLAVDDDKLFAGMEVLG